MSDEGSWQLKGLKTGNGLIGCDLLPSSCFWGEPGQFKEFTAFILSHVLQKENWRRHGASLLQFIAHVRVGGSSLRRGGAGGVVVN